MRMITVGGRIKAASVGIKDLYESKNVIGIENIIRQLRKKPNEDILKSFFPADSARIKQLLNGIGLFRPMLKTDQGMGGNFLPFYIDETVEKTELAKMMLVYEEGVSIPEPHFSTENGIVGHVQKLFHDFKLSEIAKILENLDKNGRKAEKGRDAFFFIRPAKTDKKIVFGKDITGVITSKTNNLLSVIAKKAEEKEKEFCGFSKKPNLLYCQPDVFILANGSVEIEKINCPDLGFFLQQLDNPYSQIVKDIQFAMSIMQKQFFSRICDVLEKEKIAIVTRDEVMINNEDILEQKEIENFIQNFTALGKKVSVYSLARIKEIPAGSDVILLNLNYHSAGINKLLERHCKGELNFFPNPFFQMACGQISGLPEVEIDSKYQSSFIQLIGSQPKDERASIRVYNRIESILAKKGINHDVLHVDIKHETVPVFRKSLYSWKQLARRIRRYENIRQIKIRCLPVTPEKLLLDSSTGPRLHAYRFLFVCDN